MIILMKINTMIHASLSRFKKTTYIYTCIPSVYVQGRLFRQIRVVDCVLITHKYIRYK